MRNAADVQIQATDSIAAAERGVESARLSGIDTTAQAATKADAYREALAKLSPEQRDLYDSIAGPNGLTKAYKAWVRELQPDVLPIFTRGVDGAKKSLPGLSPLVRNSAKAVSELQASASRDLKRPFWQRFKKDIATGARPAIVGLGKAFGNTLKGMAGVVDAFLPHMDSIADRMVKSTRRFANWGTGLKGSSEFEKFLDYADTTGKILGETFGDLMDAFFEVSRTLRPISEVVLKFLGGLAEGIAIVAEKAPWMVQGIWLAIVAMKVWTVVQWALNAAISANPIGLIILALVALVAAGIYAFNKFPWFRDLVLKAWDGIKTASMWLWGKALKPFFEWFGVIVVWLWEKIIKPYVKFMIAYWTMVGTVISWLWRKVFRPYFGFIGDLIAWWWRNIVKRYFGFVVDGIKVVGAAFAWLYRKGVKPQMEAISAVVSYIYNKGLKPAFGKIKTAVGLVAAAFESARKGIKASWDKVVGITARPANFVIKWVYEKGIKAVWDKVAGFVGLDKLPKGPKPLPERFARGGRTRGGTPGVDSIPILAMADEYILRRDSARKIGFSNLEYMNRTGELPGVQKFADGGLVGALDGAWDWTKDTVSDAVGKGVDWAKAGADLMTDPSKVWGRLTKPIVDKLSKGLGTAQMGKVLTKYPLKMISALKGKIVDAASSMFSGDGSGGGGVWAKPVNAAYGTRFGVPGLMWSSGRHTGLDFPAATGTTVRAVDNGTVARTSSGGPYGNNVLISHGGGLQSLYAHLSKILTSVGAKVTQGQTIGRVGATGNVTGPHLHLEARRNGTPVNPMSYLTGPVGNATASGAAQQYAKSILSRYGWGASQFGPLKKLWDGESNWRWNAKNPSSGAYGIPQSLPASKMASAGSDWRTNYQTQIRWGLGYIKGRPDYGSPAAAYSKWLARSPHWYDDGGYLPPGLSLVANGTGKPEPVFTSGQWDTLRASAGGGAPAVEVFVESKTYLDGREVGGFVDQRIDVREAQNSARLLAGRYV
ncbi:aggregation-promoting factor C-terminal-like domain-containing protein [Streptomyces scabiei]|uniref:aggregation-promoting factor C-terminal-like domain-containing protein n=2 Tax=Streptomyces scabiei TaxID=1930 RepID=UPI0029C00A66|nr:peptidoglycan DD-metalloendopeptidase family protein [Streptomyces scabiei]